jgi:energy-coupling factor transporter ATP-binding protein EcfA2
MKKPKIIFEEGCFDNLEEEMTQEELDELIAAIEEQVESGEFFENATPVSELSEEEQQEIYNMINNQKNTRQ